MSTRNFLIATIVASAALVNAQSIPEACTRVSELVGSCVPSDATEQDILGPTVANCICKAGNFDKDLVDCITEAGSLLPSDYEQALEAFRGYCSIYGNGGGPGPDPSPSRTTGGGGNTPTPTQTGDGTGSEYCDYFLSGISQCWTDSNPLPTAPPVARCLCGGGQFDTAVEGCYSDLANVNPDGASTVAAFAGFCSSYSAGAFDSPSETTNGGSNPTRTPGGGFDTPTSNTRIIQSPTNTPADNDDDEEENNNGPPSAGATIKVAALGTSLVALLAGAALFL